MGDFNIETVRSQFPALAAEDQILFDNAGGSQTLGTVIESIRDYLLRSNVQLGATYKTGKLATERYNAGFEAGARYVNAEVPEIVFGSSTTQLFRNVSFTLDFAEGDEIVVSSIDHETNIAPWVDLARAQKLVLKWWTPTLPPPSASPATTTTNTNVNPQLLPSNLTPLLSPRTRLVACTHASNVLGTIHPIAEIAAAVRAGPAPDALVVVDGVSYAPHRPVDVKALDVDVYAFSWYKVYGPHIAMLYASERARGVMRSLGHFFKKGDTLEEKVGLAGASYELLHSIPLVTSYLNHSSSSSFWPLARSQEELLQKTLLTYLTSRPDVTIYGHASFDPAVRVSTISFRVAGYDSKDVVAIAENNADMEVGIRWGAFYSERLVKELLGMTDDGIVRASMVHYNTVDEVNKFIEVMEKHVPKK